MNKRDLTAIKLYELKDEIKINVRKALQLIEEYAGKDSRLYNQAKYYWYAHILCALDNDHDFLGGNMITLENSIDEILKEDEVENDDK